MQKSVFLMHSITLPVYDLLNLLVKELQKKFFKEYIQNL